MSLPRQHDAIVIGPCKGTHVRSWRSVRLGVPSLGSEHAGKVWQTQNEVAARSFSCILLDQHDNDKLPRRDVSILKSKPSCVSCQLSFCSQVFLERFPAILSAFCSDTLRDPSTTFQRQKPRRFGIALRTLYIGRGQGEGVQGQGQQKFRAGSFHQHESHINWQPRDRASQLFSLTSSRRLGSRGRVPLLKGSLARSAREV